MVKKMVGVRKQFLNIGDDVVLAFLENGKKFPQCESFTEVSANVTCKVSSICIINILIYLMIMKVLPGLSSVDLKESVKEKG